MKTIEEYINYNFKSYIPKCKEIYIVRDDGYIDCRLPKRSFNKKLNRNFKKEILVSKHNIIKHIKENIEYDMISCSICSYGLGINDYFLIDKESISNIIYSIEQDRKYNDIHNIKRL